jgi:putative acetyltransferase
VQPETRRVDVSDLTGGVEAREDDRNLLDLLRRQPPSIVVLEETPESAVAEATKLQERTYLMQIRPELPEDIEAIRQITKAAFEPIEHSDHTEAAIVDALREAEALTISLVAVADGGVVGHVAFSRVAIDEADKGWYGLGPVSVRPNQQKRGLGGRLIREGLDRLAQIGAKGCVVLGDPAYYRRFGFASNPGLRFEGAPAECFMGLAFDGVTPTGRLSYHAGFNAS